MQPKFAFITPWKLFVKDKLPNDQVVATKRHFYIDTPMKVLQFPDLPTQLPYLCLNQTNKIIIWTCF